MSISNSIGICNNYKQSTWWDTSCTFRFCKGYLITWWDTSSSLDRHYSALHKSIEQGHKTVFNPTLLPCHQKWWIYSNKNNCRCYRFRAWPRPTKGPHSPPPPSLILFNGETKASKNTEKPQKNKKKRHWRSGPELLLLRFAADLRSGAHADEVGISICLRWISRGEFLVPCSGHLVDHDRGNGTEYRCRCGEHKTAPRRLWWWEREFYERTSPFVFFHNVKTLGWSRWELSC